MSLLPRPLSRDASWAWRRWARQPAGGPAVGVPGLQPATCFYRPQRAVACYCLCTAINGFGAVAKSGATTIRIGPLKGANVLDGGAGKVRPRSAAPPLPAGGGRRKAPPALGAGKRRSGLAHQYPCTIPAPGSGPSPRSHTPWSTCCSASPFAMLRPAEDHQVCPLPAEGRRGLGDRGPGLQQCAVCGTGGMHLQPSRSRGSAAARALPSQALLRFQSCTRGATLTAPGLCCCSLQVGSSGEGKGTTSTFTPPAALIEAPVVNKIYANNTAKLEVTFTPPDSTGEAWRPLPCSPGLLAAHASALPARNQAGTWQGNPSAALTLPAAVLPSRCLSLSLSIIPPAPRAPLLPPPAVEYLYTATGVPADGGATISVGPLPGVVDPDSTEDPTPVSARHPAPAGLHMRPTFPAVGKVPRQVGALVCAHVRADLACATRSAAGAEDPHLCHPPAQCGVRHQRAGHLCEAQLPRLALPCPALPCPALPCSALPCLPALRHRQHSAACSSTQRCGDLVLAGDRGDGRSFCLQNGFTTPRSIAIPFTDKG